MLCKYLLKTRKSVGAAEGLVWLCDVKPRAYGLEGTLQTLSSTNTASLTAVPSQARLSLSTLSLGACLEPVHGGFCLDLEKEKCGPPPI